MGEEALEKFDSVLMTVIYSHSLGFERFFVPSYYPNMSNISLKSLEISSSMIRLLCSLFLCNSFTVVRYTFSTSPSPNPKRESNYGNC